MDEALRTIEYLIALYQVEPTLRDIHVEGFVDRIFIESFLDGNRVTGSLVYEIGTVYIPAEITDAMRLENNNRGRTIALAILLEKELLEYSLQVMCVVDKDFDNILNVNYECKLLYFTDYACLEMYAFNEPSIRKFLNYITGRIPRSVPAFLENLANILQELFLIRLTNQQLGWNLHEVTWDRCCTINKSQITFDVSDYTKRYLNSNNRSGDIAEFSTMLENFRTKLTSDPRNQMHGHDFVNLLRLILHKRYDAREFNDDKVVERTLLLSIDPIELMSNPLFIRLLQGA